MIFSQYPNIPKVLVDLLLHDINDAIAIGEQADHEKSPRNLVR